MIRMDNPAGHLYQILAKARRSHESTPAAKVWESVLGTSSEVELYEALFHLRTLIEKVRELVESNPTLNHELLLKDYENIELALNIRKLDDHWGNSATRLNDTAMTSLANIADRLSGTIPEQPIPDDELQEVSIRIAAMFELVRAAKIDDAFRALLLGQLETMRRSVVHYQLRGVRGMREALEHSIGMLVLNGDTCLKYQSSDVAKGFGELIVWFDRITSAALKFKELVGPIIKQVGFDN
jgi:hypothetical protein